MQIPQRDLINKMKNLLDELELATALMSLDTFDKLAHLNRV